MVEAMETKEQQMPKMHVRGDTLTITIPAAIREEIAAHDGEEIEVTTEGRRIVLTAKETAERHPAIDAALAEAFEDERAGRLSPKFSSAAELKAWLKTPEGKKFGTA